MNVSFASGQLGGVALETEVVVYDVSGRRVRTIAKGIFQPGVQHTTWNGLDAGGGLVASGIYFLNVSTGLATRTRKIVVVR